MAQGASQADTSTRALFVGMGAAGCNEAASCTLQGATFLVASKSIARRHLSTEEYPIFTGNPQNSPSPHPSLLNSPDALAYASLPFLLI